MRKQVVLGIFAVSLAVTGLLGSSQTANAGWGGYLIKAPGGTVYLVENGQRRPFRVPEVFYSHGYNFNQVIQATTEDLALPLGSLMVYRDGTLIKAPFDPLVYLVTNGQKRGFQSAAAFLGLGYSFNNVVTVDPTTFDDLPTGVAITSTGLPHDPGAIVIFSDGTVYLITETGRKGFATAEDFLSYGYAFGQLAPANQADASLSFEGVMSRRTSTTTTPSASLPDFAVGEMSVSPRLANATHAIEINKEAIVRFTIKNVGAGSLGPDFSLSYPSGLRPVKFDDSISDNTCKEFPRLETNQSCTYAVQVVFNQLSESFSGDRIRIDVDLLNSVAESDESNNWGIINFDVRSATSRPKITSLEPSSGSAGQRVVITGTDLFLTGQIVSVKFGTTPAEVPFGTSNSTHTVVPNLTPGTYGVTVQVGPYTTNALDFTVTGAAPATNRPPSIPTISGPTSVVVNTNNLYTVLSTDPDGDKENITYGINWGDGTPPASKSFGSGYGYSVYHTWLSSGIYTVIVSASDGKGVSGISAPSTISVKVSASTTAASTLSITLLQGYNQNTGAYSSTQAVIGQYLILYGTFASSGNTIRIYDQFPKTTYVDYTPTFQSTSQINVLLDTRLNGNYTATVLVRDSSGNQTNIDKSIYIAAASSTTVSTPSITTTSLPNATVGQPYSQLMQATGGTAPYRWTTVSTTYPTGCCALGLSGKNGSDYNGQFDPVYFDTQSGSTVPTSYTGTYSWTIKVTDAAGNTATKTLSLTINVAPATAPTAWLTVNNLYTATVNVGSTIIYDWGSMNANAGSAQLQIVNSSGQNVSSDPCGNTSGFWSFVSGTSGQRTSDIVASCQAGYTYKITYTVTSTSGLVATAPLATVIVRSASVSTPSITTTSLPNATVGQPYSTQIQVSGGTAPYSWSTISTTYPSGCCVLGVNTNGSFNTQSSSTVLEPAGTYSWNIKVTDANGNTATKTLSLTINAAPVPTPTLTIAPNSSNFSYGSSYTLNMTTSPRQDRAGR